MKYCNKFNHALISNNELNPLQCLELSTLIVENKLSECATSYKRKKKLLSNHLFVPPKEISLGLRWDILKENAAAAMIPRLIPCKGQIVSITDTVSLSEKNFEKHILSTTSLSKMSQLMFIPAFVQAVFLNSMSCSVNILIVCKYK